MIDAVIFDLDETIHNRAASLRVFLERQYGLFDLSECLPERSFIESYMAYQQNGRVTAEVVYERLSSEFSFGSRLRDSLITDFRSDFGNAAVPFPRAAEILSSLCDFYRLGLITNGGKETQNRKIDSMQIRSLFGSIKISGEEGVKKPDHEIFLRCLSDLDTKPSDGLFIGDNPIDDVMAAKSLGLKAIWMRNDYFDRPETCDGIVDEFAEIPSTIRQITEQNTAHNAG